MGIGKGSSSGEQLRDNDAPLAGTSGPYPTKISPPSYLAHGTRSHPLYGRDGSLEAAWHDPSASLASRHTNASKASALFRPVCWQPTGG